MEVSKKVKKKIEELIEIGEVESAKKLLQEYYKIGKDDFEYYSYKGIINIIETDFESAIYEFKTGLFYNDSSFDLNYNLAFAYENISEYSKAHWHYNRCTELETSEETKVEILNKLYALEKDNEIDYKNYGRKIVFFVKKGMDTFLGDIIDNISKDYNVLKIIVTEYSQIDLGMKWADVCWFEWCDELVVYGSKLDIANEKKIVCRLHSYEAFTDFITKVTWHVIDKLIFISYSISDYVTDKIKEIDKNNTIVIPNGINLGKWTFKEHKPGFNIAYVGYINYKKGPMLLLHAFKAIYDMDNRYKLYIAGQFQDARDLLYFNQMIKEFRLEDNLFFEGWQDNLDDWLEDKDYIICTSILESQNMSIMQAMSKGIKPLVHNFYGARDIYREEYIWNDFTDLINLINNNVYNSVNYRDFVVNNYSLDNQILHICTMIRENFDDNIEYMITRFIEFYPYDSLFIDNYNFSDSKILIGKVENLNKDTILVEFIMKNNDNKQLIINNVLYNKKLNQILMPEDILNSINKNIILENVKKILSLKLNYTNGIAGFTNDADIIDDIKTNDLFSSGEKAIPATQYMPAIEYLRIIERYIFVSKFIESDSIVLEATSGFGYGANYLSRICKKVFALDLEIDNINFASNSYSDDIEWVNGDVTNLPFGDNMFDVYTSLETFEHIPIELIERYFVESKRVLKDDGVMIISTPNRETRININNPFHTKEYSVDELDIILKKYFKFIKYYSVLDYKVEIGYKNNSTNIIAVCSDIPIFKNINLNLDTTSLIKARYMLNPNDTYNIDILLDELLFNNEEQLYMNYISDIFIKNSENLDRSIKNYYINMYRKFKSYSRFKYLNKDSYEQMYKIGKSRFDLYYNNLCPIKVTKRPKTKKKLLFILNGLDINQSVTQFFINYLKTQSGDFEYTVMSLLNECEFNSSIKSIDHFKKMGIEVFVPHSNDIEEKIREFYLFICNNNFDFAVYQSLYFAPIGIFVLPLLEKVCSVVGKIQFQQPERFFDEKVDFVFSTFKKDNFCKNILELVSPINTDLIDRNLDIRTLYRIEQNYKILISIGRSIKYTNDIFWSYIDKILDEVDNACVVIFGYEYKDVENYVDKKWIEENKLILAGFNLNASSYLKSCDFYLDSFPASGGYSKLEAYYAGLPLITFYTNENHINTYDAISAGYLYTTFLYRDAEKVFPKDGNYEEFFYYSKRMLEDQSYIEFVQSHRKIEKSNLSFPYFVNSFEKFILKIEREKYCNIVNK